MRPHFLREQAQAVEDFFLRHGLERIQQEVHAIDADRLPLLELADQAGGITYRDSLGRAGLVAGAGSLLAQRRQQSELRIRFAWIRLARGEELRGEIVEGAGKAFADLHALGVIFMTIEKVHRRDGFVDELADRGAVADYFAIALGLLVLLGESAEGQAETAHPALGGSDLGAWAGDRDP